MQYVGRRSQLKVREGAFEWPTIKATVEQVIWDLDEGGLATVSPLEVRERVEHELGLERGDLQSFRRYGGDVWLVCALICACTPYVRAAAGLFRTCEVIQTIPLVCRDIMSLATETASQWHTHHGLDAASTSSKQD